LLRFALAVMAASTSAIPRFVRQYLDRPDRHGWCARRDSNSWPPDS